MGDGTFPWAMEHSPWALNIPMGDGTFPMGVAHG